MNNYLIYLIPVIIGGSMQAMSPTQQRTSAIVILNVACAHPATTQPAHNSPNATRAFDDYRKARFPSPVNPQRKRS